MVKVGINQGGKKGSIQISYSTHGMRNNPLDYRAVPLVTILYIFYYASVIGWKTGSGCRWLETGAGEPFFLSKKQLKWFISSLLKNTGIVRTQSLSSTETG